MYNLTIMDPNELGKMRRGVPSPSNEEVLDLIAHNFKNGVPPKFDPTWMLDVIIIEMSDGASETEVALRLGIGETVFAKWIREIPIFRDVVSLGRTLSKAWWLRIGRQNLTNNKFNTQLWAKLLAVHHGISANIMELHVSGEFAASPASQTDFSQLEDDELQTILDLIAKTKVLREERSWDNRLLPADRNQAN